METATRCASLMNEASQLLVEAMQRGTEEQRSEVEVSMEEVRRLKQTPQLLEL